MRLLSGAGHHRFYAADVHAPSKLCQNSDMERPRKNRTDSSPDPKGLLAQGAETPTVVLPSQGYPSLVGDPRHLFQVDEIVAERYRIVRYIDQGAVGEVYEAEDLELEGQRVALKALRPEAVASSADGFKREVQLARQVTHPNVCRIYDFGQETGRATPILFFTMELLQGETLWRYLRKQGPLGTEEALPLIRQMVSGLEAASKAGVIHRDFKSGNVMLVPDPGEEGGARVVITDFGLARTSEQAAQAESRHHVVGTPAYMAPEQLNGGEVTSASDLYAVGVVIFEMLTGNYPFEGGSTLAAALKRLSEAPDSPRKYVPDLDPRWENAILRCLHFKQEQRYPSGTALLADLEEPERRPWFAAATLLLALLGVAWFVGFWGAGRQEAASIALSERPTLALLDLRNLGGNPQADWLSPALTEMLAMEAAASEELRIVPGENVAEMAMELDLDFGEVLTPQQLQRIGERLRAELVLVGSYLRSGGGEKAEIRLDVQIKHTASGEVLARVSERGREDGVLDLVETAGSSLRSVLGLADLSEQAAADVRASMPSSVEATKLYAEGLRALRLYDAQEALALLQAAAESDPENARIRTALSAAWATLGYWSNAREQSRLAFELSENLGETDRKWVTARHHETAGDRREAVAIYRELWQADPENLEAGLRLASAQVSTRQGKDALVTVEALREIAPDEPRVDLVEAEAARTLSHYPQQQESAARAREKAEARGARLLMARAWEVEAGAWRDLGKPDEAKDAYEAARKILSAAGHRGAVARSMIAIAKIHRYHGRFEEARALAEESLVIAREIGDQGTIEHGLNLLALIARQQGRLREARDMHERELATNRETGDNFGTQVTLTSLGMAERRMGDLQRARATFAEGLEMARASGNARSIAINLHNYGEVLLRQGEIAEAKTAFQEALDLNQETKTQRGRAYYLSRLGETALIENDLSASRAFAEEALKIREEIDERTNLSYSRLALAEIDLAEGDGSSALQRARTAAEELAEQDAPDSEAEALAMVALAAVVESQQDVALEAIERAETLLANSENQGVVLRVGIAAAQVRGDTPDMRRRLAEVIEEARELTFINLALEAAILLGRYEAGSGDGHARLEQARREASAAGFHRLASAEEW